MIHRSQQVLGFIFATVFGCVMPAAWSQHNQAASTDRDTELQILVTLGATHDSNVAIDDIDQNTGLGDVAARVTAQVRLTSHVGNNSEAQTRYKFSRSTYQDFPEFDLQTHLFSAKFEHDFGATHAGISYIFADSSLDGEGYLSLNQLSPYVSHQFGKRLYARGYYTYTNRSFDEVPERDADVNKVGTDMYYFIDGTRRYLKAGYSYVSVDAVELEFDYNAYRFKLGFVQRFKLLGNLVKFDTTWRYEHRGYDDETPLIGQARDDDRHRIGTGIEMPLTERVFFEAKYEYSNFNSNLPSADYSQSKFTVLFGAQF